MYGKRSGFELRSFLTVIIFNTYCSISDSSESGIRVCTYLWVFFIFDIFYSNHIFLLYVQEVVTLQKKCFNIFASENEVYTIY